MIKKSTDQNKNIKAIFLSYTKSVILDKEIKHENFSNRLIACCFISTTVFAGPVTAVGCLKSHHKMCNKTNTGEGVHAGAAAAVLYRNH